MAEYAVFHPVRCGCGADLTAPGSVQVTFSDGERAINEAPSSVDAKGALVDPTGQVSIGQHAGSECSACGELLEEVEAPAA